MHLRVVTVKQYAAELNQLSLYVSRIKNLDHLFSKLVRIFSKMWMAIGSTPKRSLWIQYLEFGNMQLIWIYLNANINQCISLADDWNSIDFPCRLPTPLAVLISAAVFAGAHLTPGEFPQLFVLGKSSYL